MTLKELQSQINATNARINQVKESTLFNEDEKKSLAESYKLVLDRLEKQKATLTNNQ